ncbi:hypothetical protein ACW4TU_01050 [Streptomyces sp. QTS52]
MPQVIHIQPDGSEAVLDVTAGLGVMSGAVGTIPGVIGASGGNRLCATRQVYVAPVDVDLIPVIDGEETDMLECAAAPLRDTRRPSCRLFPKPDTVVRVRRPSGDDRPDLAGVGAAGVMTADSLRQEGCGGSLPPSAPSRAHPVNARRCPRSSAPPRSTGPSRPVRPDDGSRLPYSPLILATGARPHLSAAKWPSRSKVVAIPRKSSSRNSAA